MTDPFPEACREGLLPFAYSREPHWLDGLLEDDAEQADIDEDRVWIGYGFDPST